MSHGFSRLKTAAQTLAIALSLTLAACQKDDGRLFIEPLLSDGAVFQQNASIEFGGMAAPGSLVTVSTDWDFSTTATAGLDSLWSVKLTTPAADQKRHRVVVENANTSVCFADIMIGEVWLSIGQAEDNAVDVSDGAELPTDSLIRFFVVDKGTSDEPQRFAHGRWKVASSDELCSTGQISLAFLSQLRDSLKTPVGVVIASCPGAPSKAWVSADVIPDDKSRSATEEQYDVWRDANKNCAKWLQGLERTSAKNVESVYDDYMCVARPDISLWPRMTLPGKWAVSELPGFSGVVWFAKDITIPKIWRNRDLRLRMGRIGGSGVVYANQTLIGEFNSADVMKKGDDVFEIPQSVTASSEGVLSLAIRVLGSAEEGGFGRMTDGSEFRIEPVVPEGEPVEDILVSAGGQWSYYAVALAKGDRLALFGTPENAFMKNFRTSLSVPYDFCGSVANKMLSPLAGKVVSGIICKVGEEDDNPSTVSYYIPLIVKSVRKIFADDKLRFYFVQRGRRATGEVVGNGVREAQLMAVSQIDGVRIVPTVDLKPYSASTANLVRQWCIGTRLASLALADAYGFNMPSAKWPVPVSATTHNQIVTVKFANSGGLVVKIDRPTAFEVAGSDSVFYPARALAGEDGVTVFSHMVHTPVYVRYAHYDSMEPTLFSETGLPAPSFFFRATPESGAK